MLPNQRPRTAPAPVPTSFGGTLGVIALAFGIGIVGAYVLDAHAHTCDSCGHKWRHLGAFNVGDQDAHTCKRCGTTQWWKCGVPQMIKDAHRDRPMSLGHVDPRPLAIAITPMERALTPFSPSRTPFTLSRPALMAGRGI